MHAEYDLAVEFSHVSEPVIACERLDLHHISASDLVTLYEDPENLSIYNKGDLANQYSAWILDIFKCTRKTYVSKDSGGRLYCAAKPKAKDVARTNQS